VGQRQRGEASIEKLRELNPYVNVENYQGELTDDFLAQFGVVVLSETDGATLTRINNFCRASQPQKGFISCESWGASGYAFLDYGEEFTVFDQTGEECKNYLISGIT